MAGLEVQPASFLRGNIHSMGAWYGHILLVSMAVTVDTSVRVWNPYLSPVRARGMGASLRTNGR
jgi:hypothetical protein